MQTLTAGDRHRDAGGDRSGGETDPRRGGGGVRVASVRHRRPARSCPARPRDVPPSAPPRSASDQARRGKTGGAMTTAPHDERPAREERARAPVEHFERLARESADPWDYATSEYEQAKYRRTLAYLPAETSRTLELGCSVGVFTAMLAPRATHLTAVDFSPTALARARERLADADHVELLE